MRTARLKTSRLVCLVENRPGVLARIVGLISGRGYNIQRLAVGPTADGSVSRMRIDIPGSAHAIRQIVLQLRACVDVIEVSRHPAPPRVSEGAGLARGQAPRPPAALAAGRCNGLLDCGATE